ncbi:MAG TPA: hypothetical protein PK443_03950, partial [bacterium]|nr:hypothetical protein [bacterium]
MSESSRSSKKTKKSVKWLIRTTDCKILGPYNNEQVKELIGSKKVVFLDEIAQPGEDWTLIKNIDDFRELALGADYSLSESTANFDIEKLEASKAKKRKVAPPKFKKPTIIMPDLEDGEYVYKAPLMVKKHNVLIPAVVVIGVLAVIGLGYWAFESSVAKRS